MAETLQQAQAWDLLLHTAMLSLLAVGGAMAIAPDLQRLVVAERGWLSESQFTESVALAQAAPGPNILFIAVVGWNAAGVAGVKMPTRASKAPATPAAFQPTTAMNKMLGPGAACASATDSVNRLSLSQPRSATTKRCRSGAIAIAPQTASSDSIAVCSSKSQACASCRVSVMSLSAAGATRRRPAPGCPDQAPPRPSANATWR